MTITTAITVTIIALLLSGLFSGSEIAFVQSSKVRMEIDAARGGLLDRIIRGFSRHEDMFISSLLVGNNIVLVVYGITFSVIINPYLEKWLLGGVGSCMQHYLVYFCCAYCRGISSENHFPHQSEFYDAAICFSSLHHLSHIIPCHIARVRNIERTDEAVWHHK